MVSDQDKVNLTRRRTERLVATEICGIPRVTQPDQELIEF